MKVSNPKIGGGSSAQYFDLKSAARLIVFPLATPNSSQVPETVLLVLQVLLCDVNTQQGSKLGCRQLSEQPDDTLCGNSLPCYATLAVGMRLSLDVVIPEKPIHCSCWKLLVVQHQFELLSKFFQAMCSMWEGSSFCGYGWKEVFHVII